VDLSFIPIHVYRSVFFALEPNRITMVAKNNATGCFEPVSG
jgi:hypothetical protein